MMALVSSTFFRSSRTRQNLLPELFQIEFLILPVVQITMILGRDLQVANPALERLAIEKQYGTSQAT